MKLDANQAAAAHTEAARVLVLAGAGSGKTRTIIQRVQYLYDHKQQDPARILLATFTQRAAREMSDRLSQTIPEQRAKPTSGTFHALALQSIRRYATTLGLDANLGLLSRDDQHSLIQEAIDTHVPRTGRTDSQRPTSQWLLRLLSWAQNHEWSLEHTLRVQAPEWLCRLSQLEHTVETYTQLKASSRALDFDDLMVMWRLLLDPAQPTAISIASAYDHIFVDEYQDTTPIQAGITEALAQNGASLFVVGDDAQSIYGFRGARLDNILEFPMRAPTEVHRLVVSYRNTPAITELAKHTIEHNTQQFPKPLRSAKPHGPPIKLWIAEHEQHEAQLIAQEISALHRQGVHWNEQAILVRRNRDITPFITTLQSLDIPLSIRNPQRLVDRPSLALFSAHLRILREPTDRLAWRKILQAQPGIGPTYTLQLLNILPHAVPHGRLASATDSPLPARLRAVAQGIILRFASLHRHRNKGLQAVINAYLPFTETYPPSAQFVDQETHLLRQMGDVSIERALDKLGLDPTDADTTPSVRIGTIHSAKGIEWRAVFVPGLCEGRFPGPMGQRSIEDEAEERRVV